MILIIDNYDSFTYNLYQYVGSIDPDVTVVRNDRMTTEQIRESNPSHLIISPGPGFPRQAGISIETVQKLGAEYPILGVCLGHQAIGEAYGGKIVHGPEPVHGKTARARLDPGCPLFAAMPEEIEAGRYHSLVVERESLPKELMITAETEEGLIMAIQHRHYPVFGVQFHPESVLTPEGLKIIENFLAFRKGGEQ
ncbi:anthranilate synthase, component II [Syntrophobotulus glycolicus DSM 8271]|uniref:Anthranilate synthase, component II n=1 Tax=Syntrophobotulus glycolicus (strain DSM 8271 / FlGlyR) TaxID=645991 RepID=F0SZ25_SYNGF|nr:aminodeoxychorismate/anthranilate synthase component II [Syntrophobotulus glycolicus]ADY57143.1 anthranilate synthase, component II [Syntrophobotulus glycolicus DSM 8271]